MINYYEALTKIRYYGTIPDRVWIEKDSTGLEQVYASLEDRPADLEKWNEPPHLFLANLLSDETGWPKLAALRKFTVTYGILNGYKGPESWIVNPANTRGSQTLLQKAWRGDMDELSEIEMGDVAQDSEASFTRDGMELRIDDLWTLTRMLLLRDHAAGRARVCAIEDCPRTPYFLQARKGQHFCSHPCAVLANVRRFREVQANRLRRSKSGRR